MIKFENIGVKFPHKGHVVEAVKNVSFNINRGEIFGIVGTSGAGKSTLLRTVNLLQKPTSGKVYVDGKDITELKGEDLRREKIG